MKVLFVSSGNSGKASILVQRQAESLMKQGIEIYFYLILGKGFIGYLNNIFPLRKFLKKNKFDIIHAHYSLSAFVASLAGCNPLIVSLMGSDVKSGRVYKNIIRIFNILFSWSLLIVKSNDMKKSLGLKEAVVIPNGVNLEHFNKLDKGTCKNNIGWSRNKKHILFAADPNRPEKNYSLAKVAIELINTPVELHALEGISPDQIPIWFNAADVILLTSLWEGSPNVIKEAMACSCPIVSTKVGDVEWLFGDEPGCYIAGYIPYDIAENIKKALDFAEKKIYTNGRERINFLCIESDTIAQKIITVYKKVLKK